MLKHIKFHINQILSLLLAKRKMYREEVHMFIISSQGAPRNTKGSTAYQLRYELPAQRGHSTNTEPTLLCEYPVLTCRSDVTPLTMRITS